MKLLILFIVLNTINVIVQTIKSILTIKGGKTVAAIINAVAYGFYTIVIVYMVCDLPLLTKALIVGLVNLIGVYIVKFIEEKTRKDKLWKVEMTVESDKTEILHKALTNTKIPHNYIANLGYYSIFNCYCATQKESRFCKEIGKRHNAKFFVTETKNL